MQTLQNDFTTEITQNVSTTGTSSNNQSANIQLNPTIGSINMPLKTTINNNHNNNNINNLSNSNNNNSNSSNDISYIKSGDIDSR